MEHFSPRSLSMQMTLESIQYFHVDISENLCFFTEGSFRLGFDITVFANSLSVNLPGGNGLDSKLPEVPVCHSMMAL